MTPVAGSSGPRGAYDYTEGASPIDIDNALASSRRSSEFSIYNDDEGTMFSGPGHSANPSSVTRMSNLDPARRSWSRSRRKSHDSGVSGRPSIERRLSQDSQQSQISHQSNEEEDSNTEIGRSTFRGRRRRSPSPLPRSSVLGNLANLFSKSQTIQDGRRLSISSRRSSTSLSRRSSRSDAGSDYALESEGEERWGYSSGEENSDEESSERDDASMARSMDYDSEPPSPTMSQGLPLLASDPVFGGESRIEMDFTELEPPPPGPPSRQQIYIEEDDSTIRLVGYEILLWRQWLWRIGCVLTFGILGLLGHWFPRLWLGSVTHEKAFKDIRQGFVVVESSNRDVVLVSLHKLTYPFRITTVFPSSLPFDHSLSASLQHKSDETYDSETEMLRSLLVVKYRYSRFALDPRNGLFYVMRNWRDSSWTSPSILQSGLQKHVRSQRATLFDKNEINIEAKSTIALLIEEVIHPFYIFQIASIILWSLDDYYYYAFCIFAISVGSIATTLIETKKTINRMREMSKFSCKVSVVVDGAWIELDSADLVPGDVINLSSSQLSIIPADMFLLAGDAILNESMLTGESIPVSKVPVKDEDLAKWKDGKVENPKSFIYGGTKVVRIRASVSGNDSQGRPALAVVTRTGFDTTKGALVRSMLFPKPIGFKFYRDSVRFIGVLAAIAMLGFSISAVRFVRIGLKWQTILIRALDLITVVVPPALPATLSIGTSFAIARLKKHGIYCISPSRINVAGKINVCCFDKTGTLTEDGLDILGVRPLDRNDLRFGELLNDIHDLPLGKDKASFLHALATCHSLKMVEGDVVGDPLDVKMFEFTRWTFEEGTIGRTGVIKTKSGAVAEQTALVQTVVRPPGSAQFKLEDALKGNAKRAHFLELGVIRMFEFVSSLRRMSVVVKRLKSNSMEIYVKGAPEVMVDICEKDSFPEDYDDLLSYYTKRGYRVIAMAGKSIEGLSWLRAQRMSREQAESKLKFLGLIIFENKIKPGTAPTIQALRTAHLPCRMITGDNPLTAVSVARECGLVSQAAYVFSPSFARGDATVPDAKVEWTCMDDLSWKLDSYSLKPLPPPPHQTAEAAEIGYHDFSLAISGDVFRWMINYASLETLQRMLVKTQVFARMSPDEKNEVIERLQGLGYTVLMCGDGANDCAALKAADVGISLSEAEASVAAPFTTSTPDIGCVLELIKEGRSALVTSFSCFKYMALYSLIQFTTVTLLYSFASSLGDFQFLYIDLFIIIPIAVTMGRTLPYPNIYYKRPTASLVSKKVLSSIIGQIIITSAVQIWAYTWVRGQEWYTSPPSPDTKDGSNQLESTNFENSVLFLISCFQYILVAGVFSIGPPYRKPMWTNVLLMLSLGSLTLFNLLVLLSPPQAIVDLLTLMPIPKEGRLKLLLAVAINMSLCILYEGIGSFVVAGVVGQITQWRKRTRRIRETGGKVYKAVEGGMNN
ncbi:P-type ATPase [Lentinula detonsa]|uniref:Cation-transporting ATPase n=1 Tax=Lentinula detonsa TaxID=2804962 RepID=A0AA38QB09_9AGAR|nr:P-type ATPase [Lentinula detonsa]